MEKVGSWVVESMNEYVMVLEFWVSNPQKGRWVHKKKRKGFGGMKV